MSGSAGAELGRFAASLRAAAIPDPVLERLRCGLLHDIAVALAAHPVGAEVWPLVRDRRPAEATLLCDGGRVGAHEAAFANAQLIHARAQDDTHFGAKTHVGAAVIPAALALAEREGASGAAFATAVLVGCEVAAAVGERHAAAATARGFRASPLFGTLGAAAASASLLGLDAAAAADAIALSSSFAGGLNQTWIDGSSEYRIELGMAARNGMLAADLAASGQHGARYWYEGAAGFAHAFDGTSDDVPGPGEWVDGSWELGTRWRLLDVTYKPYPVCAILQSAVDVAISLARENDLDADAVTGIEVQLNPQDRTYPGTVNSGPYGDVAATLMSAEYCVAMALRDRTATLAGLRGFEDPQLARMIGVTDVRGVDRIPALGARVEVEVDGRGGAQRLGGELIPDPSTYGWDWDGVLANVERMEPEIAVSRDQLDALAAAVRDVTALSSVDDLVRLTVPVAA
ncbi:MAG TPA: MmgE/PrpD family protein [Conexibacter sp.]